MTITAIQNPNDPDYWTHVKNRAFRREALALVLLPIRQSKNRVVRISDLLNAIDQAARYIGFYDEEIEYRLFLDECAEAFGTPDIKTLTDEEIKWVHEVARDIGDYDVRDF